MTAPVVSTTAPEQRAGWTRARRWLRVLLGLALAAELVLWLTGRQVLLTETKVRPGDAPFVVEDYGDLAKMVAPSLVCRYFNGRRLLTRVYSYAPNDIMGRAACPATLNGNGE